MSDYNSMLSDSAKRILSRVGWQPIETAPKDGTEFVAYCDDGDYWFIRWFPTDKENADILARYRDSKFGAFCAGKDVGEAVVIPCLTHWMPLPAPPKSDDAQGGPT